MGNLRKLDKAGDVLKNLPFFKNISPKDSENYSGMFQSWENIVGKKLAGYSRIKDLDKNSLIVEADHPAIIQLLQMNYSQTMYKLNLKYPDLKIKNIRILLKNTDLKKESRKMGTSLVGDSVNDENKNRKKIDLNSIDNENFRDLLLKMKKRS